MYTQKLYVVMNKERDEIFTHISWIGLRMEPFNPRDLIKAIELSDVMYERQCDSYDTVQFFKSPERAKEVMESFRAKLVEKGEKETGKLSLVELEIQVNQTVVEEI
jgi:hypothetical protein